MKRTPPVEDAGEMLHTKHAFPPNNLGYCGPDVRGRIRDYLHGDSSGESLLPFLTKFEAAYPFVRMIAKSSGMSPFDYRVTEAYWIGNTLLDEVQPADFLEFTRKDLISSRRTMGRKGGGLRSEEAKLLFRNLGAMAKPHHTFYVLDMYSRSVENPESKEKLLELMDSCRISWGKVLEVKRDTLIVERPGLMFSGDEMLALTRPKKTEVGYDPEIRPFDSIRRADWVSVHWNFASEKLTISQVRNLKEYTAHDLRATNRTVAESRSWER